ncbi:MAG: hypothetical protein PHI12_11775 [Dehalococcoidales bacterium]|nr:hypothetical protein [Dehalococcoidales bacterium]
MRDEQEFIERRIITGLIVSSDYIARIQSVWDPAFLDSPELQIVASWCLDYFRKYGKAPDKYIQDLYMENLQSGKITRTADARYIEELLDSLSDEYGRGKKFNGAYLYDRTIQYFKAQELAQHNQEVQALIDRGEIEKAETLAASYKPTIFGVADIGIELSDLNTIPNLVACAFAELQQPLIMYPGALGAMWNPHLIRGGFVTFLAPEKRGKSYLLMEMALRAVRQRSNVAYFEAGDMSQSQILRRICTYVAQRSDKEQYCRERFRCVGDCLWNQLDTCTREDRNCDHGIFEGTDFGSFAKKQGDYINDSVLQAKFHQYPDYVPCDSHTCSQRKGSVWVQKVKECSPLTADQAEKALTAFFSKYKRRFKLATYAAGTLTVTEIKRVLDEWERKDGFVPDVILIDYADLLSADDGGVKEFRHRQDHVWRALRGLSQSRHVLVLSATQADAASYERDRLSLSNFSEDKRKLAHVTAQYGLNQDPKGREKRLGLLRVNEIVVREGDFSSDNQVCIIQDLSIGRPYLESYKV